MKAITKSNRNLIMLLVGLVILLLAYFLVFNKCQDEADQIESELKTRQEYLTELEDFKANESEYLSGIEAGKKVVTNITAKIPADVRSEDFVLYLLDMEKATGVDISSINVGDKTTVDEFDCIVDDESKTLKGETVDATIIAEMDYEQLKAVLDYIYSGNETTYTNSVVVSYDSTDAKLSVVTDLTKLCLDYEGAEAANRLMPAVNKGVDDLFGTAPVEEEEAENAENAEDVDEAAEEAAED